MRLHVKIGTHPGSYGKAMRLRKPPVIGQSFNLKLEFASDIAMYGRPVVFVSVDEIKELGPGELLYFVHLV